MTRTWFMWWQIRLVWIAFGIFAVSTVRAETLVRDFAGIDSTASIWRLPADAQFVRVLRANAETVVPVSDLVPTDRVLSCEDPNVLPGSTTKCGTVQPDTKNNWRLVAVIFPQPPPPVQKFTDISVTWKHPSDMTDIIGYRVYLKLQDCDPAASGCTAATFGVPVDIGLVDAYSTSVPGLFHEVCAGVQARTANQAGEIREGCNRKPPGAVADLKIEFTVR
jgi:hypothetical protein